MIVIAIAAVLALSSTIMVHPWFWIGIFKRHTIIADSENSGIVEGTLGFAIVGQVIIGIITFIIVIASYKALHFRIDVIEIMVLLVFSLLFQVLCILGNKETYKIKYSDIKIAVALLLSLSFIVLSFVDRDRIDTFVEKQKIWHNTTEVEDEYIPDRVTLASLFGFTSVEKPYYSNGKYIYKVGNDNLSHGYKGIILIKEHENTAKYIPCRFDVTPLPKEIREKHPYEVIVPDDVVVSDKDNIYQKYLIIERENIFAKLKITGYILQKLNGNEITEYKTVSDLPKFAR